MGYGQRCYERNRERLRDYLSGSPQAYLEIGVWKGTTLGWMATNVLTQPGSFGVGVDAWLPHARYDAEAMAEVKAQADAVAKKYRNVYLFQDFSKDWLTNQEQTPMYDLIYIDGEHTEAGVYSDCSLSWPLLYEGGLMWVDDYHRNRSKSVERGVDRFLGEVQYERLHRDYQLIVRKTQER